MTINEQIQALETSAGQAGDLVQAALCQIALNDDVSDATWDALTGNQQSDLIARFASEGGGSDVWVEGGREWRIQAVAEECERSLETAQEPC